MAKTLADTRNKLKLSKLDSQTELLSNDLDLSELAFIIRDQPPMRFEETVVSGSVNRTIEGASTVTLNLNDHYGFIKKSGRLADKVDIKIDGLWFRLTKVSKSGDSLQLTFESREVAILRTYDNFRASAWKQLTRARFIQVLVNEVREFDIPFICPELTKTPKENQSEKDKARERATGYGSWKEALARSRQDGDPIQIKNVAPTSEQLRNAEDILDQGKAMVVPRKLLVCAMMTAIQESTMYNHPWGDVYDKNDPLFLRRSGSVGLFQQMPWWGTFKQRMDPKHAAMKFYEAAQKIHDGDPHEKYNNVCQRVQNSGHPELYAQWRFEGEKLVTGYGIPGSDASDDGDVNAANNMTAAAQNAGIDNYQFMRGRPKDRKKPREPREKEDSWTCMNRLADEVGWRCFEVSGAIYYCSEILLFKSAPRARISQQTEGVEWVDFDYDIGKKNAQISLTARLDRWAAPPGSVIEIYDSGVANGRWIVNDIDRSLFDTKATVNLKKPRPQLPEPRRSEVATVSTVGGTTKFVEDPGNPVRPPGKYPHGKALREAVLNNPAIILGQRRFITDVNDGSVKEPVLKFMMAFTEDGGFRIVVMSLKTGHSIRTTTGGISAHSKGLAIDMGNFNKEDANTRLAMNWCIEHQVELGWKQLIGPYDGLCRGGPYPQHVLDEHNDHIHVGWPI